DCHHFDSICSLFEHAFASVNAFVRDDLFFVVSKYGPLLKLVDGLQSSFRVFELSLSPIMSQFLLRGYPLYNLKNNGAQRWYAVGAIRSSFKNWPRWYGRSLSLPGYPTRASGGHQVTEQHSKNGAGATDLPISTGNKSY